MTDTAVRNSPLQGMRDDRWKGTPRERGEATAPTSKRTRLTVLQGGVPVKEQSAEQAPEPDDRMIEVVMAIDGEKEMRKFCRKPARSIVAASSKKSRSEVSIKHLDLESKKKFDAAKDKDIST